MAGNDKKQLIVIKKSKGGGGHAHHGGAWKVAYADFVTAMMAFFLLMWLLGSTSKAQKAGLSDYFKNPSAIQGPGGASTSMIKLGGMKDMQKFDTRKNKSSSQKENKKEAKAKAAKISKEVEKQNFDTLLQALKAAIKKSPALKPFKDQLLVDMTPQGLRIQIVDKKNRTMFGLSSARLEPYMQKILSAITRVISKVPNRISISGHTDTTNFVKGYYREYGDAQESVRYTNWELSADRANAARREMVKSGLAEDKIGEVIGLGSSVPFDKKNPRSPVNRRISIIVMNKATEKSLGLGPRSTARVSGVEQLIKIKNKPTTIRGLKELLPEEKIKPVKIN